MSRVPRDGAWGSAVESLPPLPLPLHPARRGGRRMQAPPCPPAHLDARAAVKAQGLQPAGRGGSGSSCVGSSFQRHGASPGSSAKQRRQRSSPAGVACTQPQQRTSGSPASPPRSAQSPRPWARLQRGEARAREAARVSGRQGWAAVAADLMQGHAAGQRQRAALQHAPASAAAARTPTGHQQRPCRAHRRPSRPPAAAAAPPSPPPRPAARSSSPGTCRVGGFGGESRGRSMAQSQSVLAPTASLHPQPAPHC